MSYRQNKCSAATIFDRKRQIGMLKGTKFGSAKTYGPDATQKFSQAIGSRM